LIPETDDLVIGKNAFAFCTALKTMEIQCRNIQLAEDAFEGVTELEHVVICKEFQHLFHPVLFHKNQVSFSEPCYFLLK